MLNRSARCVLCLSLIPCLHPVSGCGAAANVLGQAATPDDGSDGADPGFPIPPVPRGPIGDTSFMPVDDTEPFAEKRERLIESKPEFAARQKKLLEARYDLGDQPGATTMSRGKPVQAGVRVKLPPEATWEKLSELTAAQIRKDNLYPQGFLPLPHPRHEEGGQVLPQFHIDEIKKQEGRNLQRFDVDLDLPEHFLPEFPAPIFLTTRPDLGDVSQGKLVTIKTYFDLFNGILTPRQLDGLRLLVTPFAQQQFNLTDDRRVDQPELGIACLDCHANGSTNAATHLDPVTRPQEMRRRLDTPTLRGVNIQRLFGSQRDLKTIEDFTEFEQLGAYFDGDHVLAAKKGFNKMDRALQVAHMAEFQQILDFPPAPKLGLDGKLVGSLATPQELRGQEIFFGKGDCASCHMPPFYTDNDMHDLATERFYEPVVANGHRADGDGPIKTFPLRGIKDTPPYLHDGRLLTLADTVEFFNLVLERKLTTEEKAALVAFLETL
jgi:cytochrome c peroxidase